MRSVFSLARYQTRQLFGTPRPYIALLIVFCGLYVVYHGAYEYLTDQHLTVQAAEFFIFSHGSWPTQLIFLMGLLLLVSDAPFLREGMSFRLIRTSRFHWLLGQILTCALICTIYLVCTAVMHLLLFSGRVTFQNEWSQPVRIAAMVPIGFLSMNISSAIRVSMKILVNGTPWGMFFLSFLYSLLLYMLLCLLLIFCNLRFRSGVGLILTAALMLLRFLVFDLQLLKWLRYVSPINQASLCEQSFSATDILYSLLYLLATCVVFGALALRATRGTDFLTRHRMQ